MIKKPIHPAGNIAFGRTVKSTLVSTLSTVEELAGTVQDTMVTIRSGVELVHGALQEPIVEQRIELAVTLQAGLAQLKTSGMSEKDAKLYLQYDNYL